jgi:peptidoglycan/xylan/chitin deacetylase (PgdA/CDA1 family)
MRALREITHKMHSPFRLMTWLGLMVFAITAVGAAAQPAPKELHHRLDTAAAESKHDVALTLDACGGGYDKALVDMLVQRRIPATIFVTKRWLDRNEAGTKALLAHPELFELEDHGTAHVPAVIGAGRRLYGMAGQPDAAHVQGEVSGAAQAIERVSGRKPAFFRGAGAAYDEESIRTIEAMGFRIAGFSVNADAGATLPSAAVAARLRTVQPGDIVIAHMNKPASGTARGFGLAIDELQRRGLRFVKLSQTPMRP